MRGGAGSHTNELLQKSNGTFDSYAEKAYQSLVERTSGSSAADPTAQDYFDHARLLHLYADEGEFRTARSFEPTNMYTRALEEIRNSNDAGVNAKASDVLHMTDEAAQYLTKMRQYAPYMRPTYEQTQLQRAIQDTRQQVQVNLRNDVHLDTPATKIEKTNDFLDKSKGWVTDTQNVHDSSVIKATRNTITKLAEKNNGIVAPPDEPSPSIAFVEYLNQNPAKFSPECREKALFALKTINNSKTLHAGLEHNEQQIFDFVWRRSYAAENRDCADDIREMTVRNLADGVTNIGYEGISQFSSVCSSGRIARTVDALTVIDQDVSFGQQGPMTVDAIRNSIFEYSQNALKTHLEQAENATDPQVIALAQSYKDPRISVDPNVESTFKQQILEDVKRHIAEEYAENLNEDTRNSIIDHVEAAL